MRGSFANSALGVENLVITADKGGQRLDNFLFVYLKGVPKTRLYRIIRKGEVRINKGRTKPDYKLQVGDVLRIPPVRRTERTAQKLPVIRLSRHHEIAQRILRDILYEDDGLLVINKPSGVAVHGGSGLSFGVIEAIRYLRSTEKALELVHRLDRDTSGCLMIAKRRSVLKVLHEQLRDGQIEKMYTALVKGTWKHPGSVCAPLRKNQLSSGERMVRVSESGQSALTEFNILQRYAEATLMAAKPITGRTHQIRVHAASVGHPIVGDLKYGDGPFNLKMKRRGIGRLFLHASSITLRLPEGNTVMTIRAPLDSALQKTLEIMAEEQ